MKENAVNYFKNTKHLFSDQKNEWWKEAVIDMLIEFAEQQNSVTVEEKDKFAIDFANWLDTLRPSQKVSVWSKTGEHSGLFTMDNEQLLDKFKRKNKQ